MANRKQEKVGQVQLAVSAAWGELVAKSVFEGDTKAWVNEAGKMQAEAQKYAEPYPGGSPLGNILIGALGMLAMQITAEGLELQDLRARLALLEEKAVQTEGDG